ncbi:MAG: type II toxin-antitoxin system VapC family toxin [Gemmataceae bacterium]
MPAAVTAALSDPAHERVLSIVTVWEIGIKVALGKLQLQKPFRVWIETAINDLALTELPITLDHIDQQMGLPFHHRDPFDRLLAAQVFVEGIPLVSDDAIFYAYGVTRVWV